MLIVGVTDGVTLLVSERVGVADGETLAAGDGIAVVPKAGEVRERKRVLVGGAATGWLLLAQQQAAQFVSQPQPPAPEMMPPSTYPGMAQ